MNFFVKGDNLSLCLYRVIRTFYLRIPQNLSTLRDSWRLGGYPWAAQKDTLIFLRPDFYEVREVKKVILRNEFNSMKDVNGSEKGYKIG